MVAIDPTGTTAYATLSNDNAVSVVDLASGTTTATIPVGTFPFGIAITPNGKSAYVTNSSDGTVSVIDLASNAVSATIPVGAGPRGLAITPDGRTAYILDHDEPDIRPIDLSNNQVGDPIAFSGSPYWMSITPDGKTGYISDDASNTVTPIDLSTGNTRAPIGVGNTPLGTAITPDGKTLFVASYNDNSVTPIDLVSEQAQAPVTGVGTNIQAVAVTPDGKTVYATAYNDAALTPIDVATRALGAQIPVVNGPLGIAITPDQAPTAAFSASAQVAGEASSFDASGSTASAQSTGGIASYRWDFGDGQTATTPSATTKHSYSKAGTYTVTLTVTDATGCSTKHIFTGQTLLCNGSSRAAVSHEVVVPPLTVSAGRPGRKGCVVRSTRSKRFSLPYKLSSDARVTARLSYARRSRSYVKSCRVHPPRRDGKGVRFKTKRVVGQDGKTGNNKLAVALRSKGKRLAPGRYRVSMTATNSLATSKPSTANFLLVIR